MPHQGIQSGQKPSVNLLFLRRKIMEITSSWTWMKHIHTGTCLGQLGFQRLGHGMFRSPFSAPDVKEFSTWQAENDHYPWTSAMSQGPPLECRLGFHSFLQSIFASCLHRIFCFSSRDSALQAAWASLRISMPLRGPSSTFPSRIFCRLNSRVKTWQP